jgi:predicted nuclease of predicted toxin-antitoxin system
MHFLIDASLPRSAAVALRQLGHDAVDVRDIGLRSATDDLIAAYARNNRQTLITRDFDFADIRNTRQPTIRASLCSTPPMMQPPRRW